MGKIFTHSSRSPNVILIFVMRLIHKSMISDTTQAIERLASEINLHQRIPEK